MQISVVRLRDHGSAERVRLHTQASRAADGGETAEIIGSRGTPNSAPAAGTGTNEAKSADRSDDPVTATSTAHERERQQQQSPALGSHVKERSLATRIHRPHAAFVSISSIADANFRSERDGDRDDKFAANSSNDQSSIATTSKATVFYYTRHYDYYLFA